jgi:hypothetical protein
MVHGAEESHCNEGMLIIHGFYDNLPHLRLAGFSISDDDGWKANHLRHIHYHAPPSKLNPHIASIIEMASR